MREFFNRLFCKKYKSKIGDSILYLNTPISESESDWVGVSVYADSLKTAIKNDAKMIAVTSDFGSGKSSLVQLLEKKFSSITEMLKYKFCRVNLWNHLDAEKDSVELHKTFLFQLTTQINPQKGSYISKKLNKNYGLLKIELSGKGFAILGFIAMIFAVCGLILRTFADEVIKWLPYMKDKTDQISTVLFTVTVILGIFILLKDGLIFSSKNSEGNRAIDE